MTTNDNIQNPQSLFFNGESKNTLNLSNYVDQVFNVAPVSKVTIPLVTKTDEDIKFDGKLSINFDNLSTVGYEQLMSYISPSDEPQVLNLTTIAANQNNYTAEESGYIVLQIDTPVANDYVLLKNEDNNMLNKDFYNSNTYGTGAVLPISAMLQVSKYQTVKFGYNSSTASTKKAYLIPLGYTYNIGESLADTRDYKAIMASIGFPDVSRISTLSLPVSGSNDIVTSEGYYSISATLQQGDYITISTEYYGGKIVYDGTNKPQYLWIPVTTQSVITFEYSLTNPINYIVFIPTIGSNNE